MNTAVKAVIELAIETLGRAMLPAKTAMMKLGRAMLPATNLGNGNQGRAVLPIEVTILPIPTELILILGRAMLPVIMAMILGLMAITCTKEVSGTCIEAAEAGSNSLQTIPRVEAMKGNENVLITPDQNGHLKKAVPGLKRTVKALKNRPPR